MIKRIRIETVATTTVAATDTSTAIAATWGVGKRGHRTHNRIGGRLFGRLVDNLRYFAFDR